MLLPKKNANSGIKNLATLSGWSCTDHEFRPGFSTFYGLWPPSRDFQHQCPLLVNNTFRPYIKSIADQKEGLYRNLNVFPRIR